MGAWAALGSAPPAAPAPEGAASDALSTAKSAERGAPHARVGRERAPGRCPPASPAEVALDALLSRLGATRVARRLEGTQGLVLIDVVVPAARYRELLEGLGRSAGGPPSTSPRRFRSQVRVEVAVTVEP